MLSASDDSTPTANTLHPELTKQGLLQLFQTKLLGLIQVSQDNTTESWQKKPVRLDNNWSGSGTLESEIHHALW